VGVERSFMADIMANPGDDAPRLIFADWLRENGQEARGEFIFHDVMAAPRRGRQMAHWVEAGRLFKEHGHLTLTGTSRTDWEFAYRDSLYLMQPNWGWFGRGFVESVTINYQEFGLAFGLREKLRQPIRSLTVREWAWSFPWPGMAYRSGMYSLPEWVERINLVGELPQYAIQTIEPCFISLSRSPVDTISLDHGPVGIPTLKNMFGGKRLVVGGRRYLGTERERKQDPADFRWLVHSTAAADDKPADLMHPGFYAYRPSEA